MAFSFVQTKQNNATGTSLVVSPISPITAGNLLVINMKFGASVSGITITDNASVPNTYALAAGPHSASSQITYQYYGVALSGGATTITISWTTSTAARITIDEFSGGLQSNAFVFDTAVYDDGTGGSPTVVLTPSQSSELIVAMVGLNNATVVAAGTGYTLATNNTSSSTSYKLSGTTAETAPFTITGTGVTWNEVAGAYRSTMPPKIAVRLDQIGTPLTDISMNGFKITNISGGVSSTDAVSISQAVGYTLQAFSASSTPADGAVTYMGSRPSASLATVNNNKIYIPRTGVVKAIYLFFCNSGTLGTSETSTASFWLNNTSATTITSVITNTAAQSAFNNTSLSIPVTAGDFFEIRFTWATWATNPTNIVPSATIYIENA